LLARTVQRATNHHFLPGPLGTSSPQTAGSFGLCRLIGGCAIVFAGAYRYLPGNKTIFVEGRGTDDSFHTQHFEVLSLNHVMPGERFASLCYSMSTTITCGGERGGRREESLAASSGSHGPGKEKAGVVGRAAMPCLIHLLITIVNNGNDSRKKIPTDALSRERDKCVEKCAQKRFLAINQRITRRVTLLLSFLPGEEKLHSFSQIWNKVRTSCCFYVGNIRAYSV